MSRKRTFNINSFYGGITDDIRTSDLSKCSHVSHFDIYRDPNRLYPMPDYVDDMNDGSTSTGMKQYDIKAFHFNGTLYAVGTKSDGTGSKMFSKASAETASWTASTTGEGTDNIYNKTILFVTPSGRRYFVTTDAGVTYLAYYAGTVTDKASTLQSFAIDEQVVVEQYKTTSYDWVLNNGANNVSSFLANTFSSNAKSTTAYVTDLQFGDDQVGILGYNFYPYNSKLLLWDGASSLLDQNINFGKGKPASLGFVQGTWVCVINENLSGSSTFNLQANGSYSLAIKYANGNSAQTLVRLRGATNTNGVVMPTRSKYEDSMTFYARIPQDVTPTTYKQGIWAVGKARPDTPLALSLLLDTTSLGLVENYYTFGHHHYFAHGEDGSISRLDTPSGTYTETCVYETLMFASDTPYAKEHNGITIRTEDLPTSATVTVKYRTDENDSWTSMGVSNTDGDEYHTFTKNADGTEIGKFQEIQYRVEVVGNAPIKGVFVTLNELDNLAYKP